MVGEVGGAVGDWLGAVVVGEKVGTPVGDVDGRLGLGVGLGIGDGEGEPDLDGAGLDFFGVDVGEAAVDDPVGARSAALVGGAVTGAVEVIKDGVGTTTTEVAAALPGPPLVLLSSRVRSGGEPRSAIITMMTTAAAATEAAATSAEPGSLSRLRPARTSSRGNPSGSNRPASLATSPLNSIASGESSEHSAST